MDNFIDNKNANILAFDEVIGEDTHLEGNIDSISILETKSIIKYLIQNCCYTTEINHEILNSMYKIIEDTKIVDWRLPHYSSCNLLAGWPGHAIFISIQYI